MIPRDTRLTADANGTDATTTGTIRAVYDRETGPAPSECVLETVAAANRVDPCELRSIHEVIDPDALDDLFEDVSPDSAQSAVGQRVVFTFEGCRVTVTDDGWVLVSPTDDRPP